MNLPLYLVVTPFFPAPDCWRGAYCYDFVRALMRTGRYDVRVFVPGKGEDYDYQGIHIYRFREKMLPSATLPFLFARRNQKAFLKKIAAVGIDCSQVSVCHGHTAFFGIYPLAVKQMNPRCLTMLHHHDPASWGLNQGMLRHFYPHKVLNFLLLRKIHEQLDCHVFISEVVKNSFLSVPDASWSCYSEYRREMSGLQFFGCANLKQTVILHNGVDTGIFASGEKKSPGFTIGCVANFGDWKSQITLLQAVNLLKTEFPELKVRFIGSGECLADCQQYVATSKLENMVSFEAERDHRQLPEFFRSLDLFVLPSYFEGFGCVFTEAYSCGVPFITCEGQGMDDLILPEERNLWLCPPMDFHALTDRIRQYFLHRPVQHLSGPVDIDTLVLEFTQQIAKMKK